MTAPAPPRLLVLQHLPAETPGRLKDRWAAHEVETEMVELDAGEQLPTATDAYAGLVVMGGPQDVWETDRFPWLADEIAFIRDWVVAQGRPFLGICLGHQLLAEAIGGRVGPATVPEIGIVDVERLPAAADDRLFAGTPANFECFQWHGAEVTSLPAGAVVLARNAACAVQAFRWGPRAYGLQYHCEVMPEVVGEWALEPAYRDALEKALGPGAVDGLRAEIARRTVPFSSQANALADGFLDIARAAARRVA